MAKLTPEPHKFFAKLVEKARAEGKGYNDMIGMAAWAMKALNVPPEQAIEMITKACENVTRRQPGPGEIHRQVKGIYRPQATLKPYDQPKTGIRVLPKLIDELASKGSITRLRERSKQIPSDSREILANMYSPDALLHLTPHFCKANQVQTCAEWITQDLSDKQFICPAHLKSRDLGRRLENVLHRHFLVYESDRPGLAENWDAQAGCIERLAKDMPLRLIVWSGNKSLHAWFDISCRRKDLVQDFIGKCIQLGADEKALRPAQLVRMPLGIRREEDKPNKQQKVIFYDN